MPGRARVHFVNHADVQRELPETLRDIENVCGRRSTLILKDFTTAHMIYVPVLRSAWRVRKTYAGGPVFPFAKTQ